MRYTAPGELVLDQMAGSGTTAVECKLLGRRAVAVDINPDAVMVARNRLDFAYAPLDAGYKDPEIKTYVGDARSLDLIGDESIDLIATHPPYASIIPYSHNRVEGDLSSVHNIAEFAQEMRKVASSLLIFVFLRRCPLILSKMRLFIGNDRSKYIKNQIICYIIVN